MKKPQYFNIIAKSTHLLLVIWLCISVTTASLSSRVHKRQSYFDLPADDFQSEAYATDALPLQNNNNMLPSMEKTTENVTVKVGQQATLPCIVNNLGSFKVIWAKNGDILALGNTKINSDTRLNVQHRYVSEWHLIIDNVATDDEGEYICKTNGNFYKTIYLQVQMPPTIDDVNSTPAGTITIQEGASITLKCFADGKPEPTIKWYRWKKYKQLVSEKEEINAFGNELIIPSVKRNDPNMYECIAKNSVPPATSRCFNIEIQFLPKVGLEIRKAFQYMHKRLTIECKISGNPLEKIYWYKNGQTFVPAHHHHHHHYRNQQAYNNIRVEKYDVSDINEYFKTLLTLTIMNINKEDFGEYQCCAVNTFGQVCSNVMVSEIKPEIKTTTTSIPITSPKAVFTTTTKFDQELPNIVDNHDEDNESSNYSEEEDAGRIISTESGGGVTGNSLDSKDKRRHYLMKSKDFMHLESHIENAAADAVSWTKMTFILVISVLFFILM